MDKKQSREDMKKEIKKKYSRLFDKLAKEEQLIGSIYNYDEIKSMLEKQNSADTSKIEVYNLFNSSKGLNVYPEQNV